MIDNNLLLTACANTSAADAHLIEAAKAPHTATHSKFITILNHLRTATAAVQELERQAAGCEPPKRG